MFVLVKPKAEFTLGHKHDTGISKINNQTSDISRTEKIARSKCAYVFKRL